MLNLVFYTKVFFCMINSVNNLTLSVKVPALYTNTNMLKTFFLYFKCKVFKC